MQITRQQLRNVIQARSAVTPQMALRFEKAFGGGGGMWLRMQAAYDLAQARKHNGKMNIPHFELCRPYLGRIPKLSYVWVSIFLPSRLTGHLNLALSPSNSASAWPEA
jgi:hypothetical protein